jgi:hypothetical protein
MKSLFILFLSSLFLLSCGKQEEIMLWTNNSEEATRYREENERREREAIFSAFTPYVGKYKRLINTIDGKTFFVETTKTSKVSSNKDDNQEKSTKKEITHRIEVNRINENEISISVTDKFRIQRDYTFTSENALSYFTVIADGLSRKYYLKASGSNNKILRFRNKNEFYIRNDGNTSGDVKRKDTLTKTFTYKIGFPILFSLFERSEVHKDISGSETNSHIEYIQSIKSLGTCRDSQHDNKAYCDSPVEVRTCLFRTNNEPFRQSSVSNFSQTEILNSCYTSLEDLNID